MPLVDEATAAPGDQDYLVIALAVGIPASLVILALVIIITAMFVLMLRKSRLVMSEHIIAEVEWFIMHI